jgi:hypothetical protein
MALQSSGQISLDDIRVEIGATQSNVSLGSMSAVAGFTGEDAMSEFYGYSHITYSTWTGSSRANTSTVACSYSVGTTYYHNNGSGGSDTYPAINDYVYSDTGLSVKLAGGYYKVNTPSFDWVRVNGFGRIFATGICS